MLYNVELMYVFIRGKMRINEESERLEGCEATYAHMYVCTYVGARDRLQLQYPSAYIDMIVNDFTGCGAKPNNLPSFPPQLLMPAFFSARGSILNREKKIICAGFYCMYICMYFHREK